MFIGVPLDYRNTKHLADVVSTFGQFHYWDHADRRRVHSLVYASFPDDILVPQSVVFHEFANWGGTIVSWTAAVYILTGGHFANAILGADEDPMPLNGNPRPMPGQNPPPQPFRAMPPYPALGWNAVPPGHEEPANNVDNGWGNFQPPQDDQGENGWGVWEEAVAANNAHDDQPEAQPAQDQNSMVLNPSLGSSDSSDANNDDVVQQNLALVPYHPPVVQMGPIHLGMVRVMYGPVLPSVMLWERSFRNLMLELSVCILPPSLKLAALPPSALPKRFWSDHMEKRFLAYIGKPLLSVDS